MSAQAASEEHTGVRSWSLRLPRRDALLVLGALVLGGGGTGAVTRFLGGAGDVKEAVAELHDVQQKQGEEIVALRSEFAILREQITPLRGEVQELMRRMRVVNDNQLLGCELLARVAKKPNPCVRP